MRSHLVAVTIASGLALGAGSWSQAEAKPASAKSAVDPDAIASLQKMAAFLRDHCGHTWYQPRYAGSQVTYVVVNPPR